MNKVERAYQLRRALQMFAETLEDDKALEITSVFPTYESLVQQQATKEKGFRFQYNDKLYRVEQPTYTFTGVYSPGVGTESLFSEIAKPGSGDLNEPILYNNNMELIAGSYYVQEGDNSGTVYICTRNTGVPVYHPLSSLIGLYVEVYAS